MLLFLNYQDYKQRQVNIVWWLMTSCLALMIMVNMVYGISTVYTHLFYIPIILTAAWFGIEGLYVALLLGGVHVMINYLYAGQPITGCLLRFLAFVVIALLVWQVSSLDRTKPAVDIEAENRYLVGEMAVALSHEIRNPLTTARGLVQLLQEDAAEQQKEYLALIMEEIDRVNLSVTQYLSLSKNKVANIAKCNLNTVIEQLLPEISDRAAEKGIQIVTRLNAAKWLLLDINEIKLLIWHLTLNGIEAMDAGGVLQIETHANETEIRLNISDQGSGIDPQIIADIGAPFVTDKPGGLGLGLAVCYSIASRHHANLTYKTGPEGTTFTVTFKPK